MRVVSVLRFHVNRAFSAFVHVWRNRVASAIACGLVIAAGIVCSSVRAQTANGWVWMNGSNTGNQAGYTGQPERLSR